MKLLFLTCAVCALLFSAGQVNAEDMQDAQGEQTTESPIADMALVEPKNDMMLADMEKNQTTPVDAQPHTIADFIIHPLIALKPRQNEHEPSAEGKQASGSSTTPSPWTLFGFTPGQGLGQNIGTSVSNLAGTVTGWLGNRIQLPGLVETPVSESSSTTSTTHRPDIVVRVQQRQPTRKPLTSNNNQNRPFNNRRNKNPNRINNNLDVYEEYDNEYEENFEDDNYRGDDDDNFSNEDNYDEDDDDVDDNEDEEEQDYEPVKLQQNNNHRRPLNNNRKTNNQRRRTPNNSYNNVQSNRSQKRRRPQESDEVEQYDDNDDDDGDQEFYYHNNQKRSQDQQNFIQRGQQTLINQIRQLTRGQTPAEIGTAVRKSQKASNNKKRRQQATLLINRNGQTIYLAPELLQAVETSDSLTKPATQLYQYYQPSSAASNRNKLPVTAFPQPPLTVPLKRKGKPTQYITIPWSQLGIAPPDESGSIAEGIQSQPLILNIPQSAINAMQNQRPNKKKQTITSDAVPLLTEASLMDIFKPPRIPPVRTPSKKPVISGSPVVIASKTKPGTQRIRPGTIVEKAPADQSMEEENESTESSADSSESSHFIVAYDDSEDVLGRSAFPHHNPHHNPYLDYLHNGRFAYRGGRQLNTKTETAETVNPSEQVIPVQVISAAEETTSDDKAAAVEEAKVAEAPVQAKLETAVNATDVGNKREPVTLSSPVE